MSQSMMVALYARVSSDQQAKSGTIESQLAALKERIANDGEQIAEEMCFVDEGVTGATLIRPQLERLRDRAAIGLLDRLYVLSPDRLARKYAHQVLLIEELSDCGVQIVFLNHAIGTTPEEALLLQMQGVIADYAELGIMQSGAGKVDVPQALFRQNTPHYCRASREMVSTAGALIR